MNREKFVENYQKYGIDIKPMSLLTYPSLHHTLTGNTPPRVSGWMDLEMKQSEEGDGEGEGGSWTAQLERRQDFIDIFHFKGYGSIKLVCNRNIINEWGVNGELLISPFKFGQNIPTCGTPFGLMHLESDNEFVIRYYATNITDCDERKKYMICGNYVAGVNEKGETVRVYMGMLRTGNNNLNIDLSELNNIEMREQQTGEIDHPV
jgi:hypothetical protein